MSVEILTARWIVTGVTPEGAPEIIDDGAIAFENGGVLAIGPATEVTTAYPEAVVTTHPNHMIIPGLVNSHHHIGLTPLQLGAPDYPLELWFAARLAMRKIDLYLDIIHEQELEVQKNKTISNKCVYPKSYYNEESCHLPFFSLTSLVSFSCLCRNSFILSICFRFSPFNFSS